MGILSALFGKKKDEPGTPPDDGGIKPEGQDAISRDQERARQQMEQELSDQREQRDAGEAPEQKQESS